METALCTTRSLSHCSKTKRNPDCHHVQKYVLDGPEAIWKKNLTNENILYKSMFVKSKGKKKKVAYGVRNKILVNWKAG